MKIKALLLMVGLAFSTTVFAGEMTDTKKATTKELMSLTGSSQMPQLLSNAFIQQMTSMLKSTNPDIPARALTILEEEVNAVIKEEVVEKGSLDEEMFPIYHKYLTIEDMQALIAFYKTPVGKKAIMVMPQLTQEAMHAWQMWGQSLHPVIENRVAQRLAKEGIK